MPPIHKPLTIALDFDGTLVKPNYPKVGAPVPGALEWVKRYQKEGARILLWTCRSGKTLSDAVNYMKNEGVVLKDDCINNNPDQHLWSKSPKAYADVYIDDAAFDAPLLYPADKSGPYLDWTRVGPFVFIRVIERNVQL